MNKRNYTTGTLGLIAGALVLCTACSGEGSSSPPPGSSSSSGNGSNASASDGNGNNALPTVNPGGDLVFASDDSVLMEGAPDFERCNELTIEFESVTPTVFILVDRSTSMRDVIGATGVSRWDALRSSLLGEGGVLAQFQSEVRFGFMAFTSPKTGGTCALEDSGGIVHLETILPEQNGFSDIDGLYAGLEPGLPEFGDAATDTPTVIAYREAVRLMLADTFVGSKYILIVSDGQPDRCDDGDPCVPQDEMVGEVQAAYEQGIHTFAMTVASDPALEAHVRDLANAGQGLPVEDICTHVNPKAGTYAAPGMGTTEDMSYRAESQDKVSQDMAQIIGGVRSCSFRMNAKVQGNVGTGLVRIQTGAEEFDTPLTYEDPNGWQLQGNDTVELLGDACEKLKDKSVSIGVDIGFPCEVIVR